MSAAVAVIVLLVGAGALGLWALGYYFGKDRDK